MVENRPGRSRRRYAIRLPVDLPSDGTLLASTSIGLCVGWNLIGFPAAQARPVRNALASIEGKYAREALDLQGRLVKEIIAFSVEGQQKIGNFTYFTLSFVDLSVPLSGLDIEVVRTGAGIGETR
jgi:hypothetical protein